MRFFWLILFVLSSPIPAVGQDRMYVDIDASEGGDGTSWETAFRSLDDALLEAASQIGTEIWVAEGLYITTEREDGVKSFIFPDGVSLFGGFNGTEGTVEERNWIENKTILSGEGVFLDGQGRHSVVVADSVTVTIDGFTITQGWNRREGGGGVRAVSSTLVLRNLVVQENEELSGFEEIGGGGVYLESSTAEFDTVDFLANKGGSGGGGLYVEASKVFLKRVRFQGNTTSNSVGFGGGLHARNSEVVIIESEFVENGFSTFTAPAFGGAIYSVESRLSVFLTRFEGNAIAGVAHSQVRGGAVYHRSAAAAGASTMANVLFAGNVAGGEYGGEARAAAIEAVGGPLVIINATIVANKVTAKFVDGYSGPVVVGPVELLNSIVWGNAGDSPLEGASVTSSLVQGGYEGEGNMEADPLFVNMPFPGGYNGDLRLSPGSPAIDAGLLAHVPPDTLDLDNDGDTSELFPLALNDSPRVLGASVDLGAYEGVAVVSSIETPELPSFEMMAYPNPFQSTTHLAYTLAHSEFVTVGIYDVLGREVKVLVDGVQAPGEYEVAFDADGLPNGVYFYRIITETNRTTRSVIKVP